MTISLEDPKHPDHRKVNSFYIGDNIPNDYTGSAVNNNDTVTFFVNGRLHRENGPAVEYANGKVEYWWEGKEYPKPVWERKVEKRKPKPTMKSYKDLYLECTGNSTKGNDGKFLIEETQEEVTVVNGVITSIVSVEKDSDETGKPKHSYNFPLTDNVRYVFPSSFDARNADNQVIRAHNYWIRDEKKVVYQSFKNVTKIPYMVGGDWDALQDRFIRQRFILKEENVVVSTENNNIRSIESLTNGHFVSFPDDGTVTFGTLAAKLDELRNDLTYTKVKSWEEKLNTNFTGIVIDDNGFVAHFKNGKCHRDYGPALFKTKKNVRLLYDFYWFKDGMIHREDGPYTVTENGTEYYALNDKVYYDDKKSWEQAVKRLQRERELTVLENRDRWTNIPTKDFTGVIKTKSKTVAYYKNGKLHRETGPAIVFNNNEPKGNLEYWLDGAPFSKTDWMEKVNSLPEEEKEVVKLEAVEDNNKQKEFTKEGHLKVQKWNAFEGIGSFTGSVIDENGIICYYKNGVQHRDGNQPSFISNIGKDYKVNGKLHRTNGPAIEYASGNTSPAFFLNGENVSEFELYTRFPWKVSELGEKPKNFNGTVDYGLGVKETFKNGQIHSFDDKPAYTNGVEYQCWYKEGKRHRIGGPAKINNNTEEYWVEGKLYTKEEYWMQFPWDEATQGYPNNSFTGTVKRKGGDVETWLNGTYHSFDDKPSYISADGTVKIWHKEGNQHRENGPAVVYPSGKVEYWWEGRKYNNATEFYLEHPKKISSFEDVEYGVTDIDAGLRREHSGFSGAMSDPTRIITYRNGKRHSYNDKPAWTSKTCSNLSWWKDGKRHRENGPAHILNGKEIYYWEGTRYDSATDFYLAHPKQDSRIGGMVDEINGKDYYYRNDNFGGAITDGTRTITYKNGQRHSFDDKPAWTSTKEPGNFSWFKDGYRHRENGPAHIKDGVETYYWEGKKYDSAEAFYEEHPLKVTQYDDVPVNFTGKAVWEKEGVTAWYRNGKLHREDDLPAFVSELEVSWFIDGKRHREGNRHAQIQANGFKGFYVNNKLHREDGQAYEAGKFSKYYLNGIYYPTKEDWQKAKYQLGIDKVPYNLVDEAKQEVSYRIARKQLVTITRKFLAEQVANKAGGTAKQKETTYSSALEFLSSELGTSVVYGAVGLLLPKLELSLPERFRVHLDKLSKEFRVSAMASVGVEMTDLLASTVGKALKNLPSSETYSLGSVSLKEKTITTTTTLEKEIVYEQHTNSKVQSN